MYAPMSTNIKALEGKDNNSLITPKTLSYITSNKSLDLPFEDNYEYKVKIDVNEPVPLYDIYLINGNNNTIHLQAVKGFREYPTFTNKILTFKLNDATNCTIIPFKENKIDGQDKVVLTEKYTSVSIFCDGFKWHIFSNQHSDNITSDIVSVNHKIPDEDGNVQLSLDDLVDENFSNDVVINKPLVAKDKISVSMNVDDMSTTNSVKYLYNKNLQKLLVVDSFVSIPNYEEIDKNLFDLLKEKDVAYMSATDAEIGTYGRIVTKNSKNEITSEIEAEIGSIMSKYLTVDDTAYLNNVIISGKTIFVKEIN